MDPHLLRTFLAVVRSASFSAAARELGYTQSAVSQHIAALEADLGASLLTRRPVAVTRAGERLLEHAHPLLLRLEAARVDVFRAAGASAAGISLAVTATALRSAAASALPGSGVQVRVLPAGEIPAAVATGSADAGLVDGIAAPSDPLRLPDIAALSTRGVAEEPVVVLLPRSHPLAHRQGVDLACLVDACWLAADGCAVPLERLRAACGGGFRARAAYQGTDLRTLTELVAAGHGLTVLPESLACRYSQVATVRVAAPRLVHRTELVHLGEPAATVAAWIKAAGWQ